MIESYRDLDVWQHAMELVEQVYGLSKNFPADERFGLTAQLRRAAVSIPGCIAEGNVRHTTRDYQRFVSIAAGSAAEVDTQLLLAIRLGYAGSAAAAEVLALRSGRPNAESIAAIAGWQAGRSEALIPGPQSPVPNSESPNV